MGPGATDAPLGAGPAFYEVHTLEAAKLKLVEDVDCVLES